jgi:hypothetical protein
MHRSIKIQASYANFQTNLSEFAKRNKDQIKSDPKFREKFNDMCQEFDVNPMLGKDQFRQLSEIFGRS